MYTQEWYGSVGVIVARFQADTLHNGWQYLIDYVRSHHEHVLVVLGDHGGLRTKDDPLTYLEREIMVLQTYTYNAWLTVKQLFDHPHSTELWTKNLDQLVADTFPNRKVVMYGSRDSFIKAYRKACGTYETRELEPHTDDSGTQARREVRFAHTPQSRQGIIYAERERPAIAYATVDLVVFNERRQEVLLIGKHKFGNLKAFPGGFVDPEQDTSDLDAAKRELSEEVPGIKVEKYDLLGDRIRVDDPRYRRSSDKIFTAIFAAPYQGGTAVAGDDAESVEWVPYDKLTQSLVPWHRPQATLFFQYLREKVWQVEPSLT